MAPRRLIARLMWLIDLESVALLDPVNLVRLLGLIQDFVDMALSAANIPAGFQHRVEHAEGRWQSAEGGLLALLPAGNASLVEHSRRRSFGSHRVRRLRHRRSELCRQDHGNERERQSRDRPRVPPQADAAKLHGQRFRLTPGPTGRAWREECRAACPSRRIPHSRMRRSPPTYRAPRYPPVPRCS